VLQVTASADDVNEDSGNVTTDDGTIWIGGGSNPTASFSGFRFTNVQVPAGATIVSAYLQFYSASGQWITLNLQIAGVLSPNSTPFTTLRPSQQPLTVARVQHLSDVGWNANTWYAFNEMAAVVQEIVNQAGWQSGNSLAIVLRNTGGAWARKWVYSRDGAAQFAPQLVIVYHQ
jgi:type IV pilus assembly protein PilY1